MFSLGIDLAARYSAAALLDADRNLLHTWVLDAGAAEKPARPRKHNLAAQEWIMGISCDLADDWVKSDTFDDVLVTVENLSHMMANPAPALRLQGAVDLSLARYGFAEAEWVLPRVWQNFYGYVKTEGMTTKGWAKWFCESLDYQFDSVGKARIDERDAALIARWRLDAPGS